MTGRGRGSHGGGGFCADDDDAYLYPVDVEGVILEAYALALEHPRFGPGGEQQQQQQRGEGATAPGVAATAAWAPAAPAGLRCVRSMRKVAVHHLACYLFSPSALHLAGKAGTSSGQQPTPKVHGIGGSGGDGRDGGGGGGGDAGKVNDDESAVERGPEADKNAPAWQPDFARRKMFDRLLLLLFRRHGGRGGGEVDAISSSVAMSVFGHTCDGSVASAIATGAASSAAAASAAIYQRHRSRTETCGGQQEGHGQHEKVKKGQEQKQVQKQEGELGEEGGRTGGSKAIAAMLRAPPPSHPGREQGGGCPWESTLGLERRRALQAYCHESDALARAAAGEGGHDGGVGGVEGAKGVVRWLDEEREVKDVVERLLRVAAIALPGGQK